MTELLTRGMNIYYRGYVIHEDIRHIHYTIYGERPQRREVARAGDSREAMRWIDQQFTARGKESLVMWPAFMPWDAQPWGFAA